MGVDSVMRILERAGGVGASVCSVVVDVDVVVDDVDWFSFSEVIARDGSEPRPAPITDRIPPTPSRLVWYGMVWYGMVFD